MYEVKGFLDLRSALTQSCGPRQGRAYFFVRPFKFEVIDLEAAIQHQRSRTGRKQELVNLPVWRDPEARCISVLATLYSLGRASTGGTY